MKRTRIDRWLVDRGIAASSTQALEWISAGIVRRNGWPVLKASSLVSESDHISILSSGPRFVSRGAHKLASGLSQLAQTVHPIWYLDVGASTGGFTHYLLNAGAKGVVTIDVGHHQLHETLRKDSRVVVLEDTHILSLTTLPGVGEQISYAVIDVSFISLRTVFPHVWQLLAPPRWCLMLFKPQFEAERHQVERGGVVRDRLVWQSVLADFLRWVTQPDRILAHCPCEIKGKKKGNQEVWVLVCERVE